MFWHQWSGRDFLVAPLTNLSAGCSKPHGLMPWV
jgi:hypothetical protein